MNDLDIQMQSQLKGTAFQIPKANINTMLGQYNTRNFDQNYSISQSINPYLLKAQRGLLNANVKNAELRKNLTKQQITSEIRQSWNAILYLEQVNRNNFQQDSLLKIFVKASALRFKTGETNQLEKTTAITKEQELLQQIKQNENFIIVEKTKLKTLLNFKSDFEISPTDFVPMNFMPLMDSSMLRQNPTLQLAVQQINMAQANREVEKAQIKPEFTGGYFIQSLTGNQEVESKTVYYNGIPRFQGITLGVSIAIFGTKSNKAKIRASETNILMQSKNVELQQSQLNGAYAQEIQQLTASKSLLDYYQNSAIPNARIIAQNAAKAYFNGDISYIEYLQGIQTSREIQLNNLQAIYAYNQRVINLQFLLNN